MRNIALIGKARSGKDSAAAHLVRTHAYTRLAFADRLKETALRANPIVDVSEYGDINVTLAGLIEDYGWEYAKEYCPEVRRFLQYFGQAMRELDHEVWLRPVMRQIDSAEWLNMPVVVTDVRYRNEAVELQRRGFLLVRLTRPGTGGDAHTSETELDSFVADYSISNNRSLQHLTSELDALPLD